MIRGYVEGKVADYQMTAWMMAVFFRGLDRSETAWLTKVDARLRRKPPDMARGGAGDRQALDGGSRRQGLVDRRANRGGLRPARADDLRAVARSHRGDTRTNSSRYRVTGSRLETEEFRAIVSRVGCCIAGASEDLVPADRRMYALRDVAGIVESHPLIVSSILSKKAAARLDGLVLDVKVGAGGFAPSRRKARALAERLVHASTDLGIRTEAFLTAMNDPLGCAIGNALEVEESIRFLRGEEISEDLERVSIEIACAMLRVGGEKDAPARGRVLDAWRSGRALDRLGEMIEAQGGDRRVTLDPARLPRAPIVRTVVTNRTGHVAGIDAREIGEIVIDLGGGRRKVEDAVDPSVGIILRAKPGERLEKGASIAELHLAKGTDADAMEARLLAAFRFSPQRPRRRPVLIDRIRGGRPRR